jgi:peroxiredoxin
MFSESVTDIQVFELGYNGKISQSMFVPVLKSDGCQTHTKTFHKKKIDHKLCIFLVVTRNNDNTCERVARKSEIVIMCELAFY